MGGAYYGAVIREMKVFSSSLLARSTFNSKGCSFLHPFLSVRFKWVSSTDPSHFKIGKLAVGLCKIRMDYPSDPSEG